MSCFSQTQELLSTFLGKGLTFYVAGEFPYYGLYPGMAGIIRVEGVANLPPTVEIVAPTNGTTLAAPAYFSIAAAAVDPDGTVTNVQFFSGPDLLGSLSLEPFIITAADMPAGSYTLTARAADDGGLASTSAPVQVNVVVPGEVRLSPPVVTAEAVYVTFTTTPQLTYVLEAAAGVGWYWDPVSTNVASSSTTTVTLPRRADPVGLYRAYRSDPPPLPP